MSKNKKLSMAVYLLFIGASFGAVIALGALSAPVVFNAQSFGVPIEQTQSGLLMGEIFRRFSYWVYGLIFVVVIMEASEYKMFRRDKYAMVFAFITVFTGGLYSSVYVPKILALQTALQTSSEVFEHLHKASELDTKILALALLALFMRRSWLILKQS